MLSWRYLQGAYQSGDAIGVEDIGVWTRDSDPGRTDVELVLEAIGLAHIM